MELTKSNREVEIIEINKSKNREIEFDLFQLKDSNFRKHLLHLDSISSAPAEFLLLGLLCSISGCAGKNYYFKASDSFHLFFNIWACCIGQSTVTRESSALNISSWDLQRIESHNYKAYKTALDSYKKSKEDKKEKEFEPERKYLLLPNDITLESFGVVLEKAQRGLIIHSELGSFLGQLSRSYAGDSKQTLTALYDVPRTFEISRQTRGNVFLERPYFSLLSASTISWLKDYTQESDLSSGFLARFIFAVRKGNSKRYIPLVDMNNQSFRSEYYINAREIYDKLCDQLSPIEIKIDKKAENLHRELDIEFYNKIILSEDENLISSLARLNVASMKFAGLIALFDKREKIKKEDVQDSYLLVDYFAKNAKYIYNELRTKSIYERKEIKVYKLIEKQKELTRKNLLRASGLAAKELNEIIQNLKEKENIIEDRKRGVGSKKSTTYYSLAESL